MSSDATANGIIVQVGYSEGEWGDAYHNPWPDVASAQRYIREVHAGKTVRIIQRVTTETVVATIAGDES